MKAVLLKGSGGAGLGDRVCGLAVAIAYCVASERALVVDWRDRAFQSHDENLFPKLFSVRGVQVVDSIVESSDVVPEIWQGKTSMELDELRAWDLQQRGIHWEGAAPKWDRAEAIARYSIDAGRMDYSAETVVLWSGGSMAQLYGLLRQREEMETPLSIDQLFGQTLFKHVQWSKQISDRINSFQCEVLQGRPSVGVHYRKTDEAAAARSLPNEQQYVAATDRALDSLPGDSVIFLATDNSAVQDQFARRYGADRVLWTEKWLPQSGQSIHKNVGCPDGAQAAIDALVDVGILAATDQMVLTGNSSFSSMARWFSGRSDDSGINQVFPPGPRFPQRFLGRIKRLVSQQEVL